jgi:hypothetical protein
VLGPAKPAKRGSAATSKPKSSKAVVAPAEPVIEEVEEEEEEAEGVWTCKKWVAKLTVPELIRSALKVPPKSSKVTAFDYVRRLKRERIEELMEEASLSGLVGVLADGVERLRSQKTASSAQLNDKFQATGKFQMSYGSLSLFYGGLESLLGPPSHLGPPPSHLAGTARSRSSTAASSRC